MKRIHDGMNKPAIIKDSIGGDGEPYLLAVQRGLLLCVRCEIPDPHGYELAYDCQNSIQFPKSLHPSSINRLARATHCSIESP